MARLLKTLLVVTVLMGALLVMAQKGNGCDSEKGDCPPDLVRNKRQESSTNLLPTQTITNQIAASETGKPASKDWIKSSNPDEKRGLVRWLIRGCPPEVEECKSKHEPHHVEYPGYDGWYNNPAHPELGAVDTPLLRRTPAFYADGVYKPVEEGRPNPIELSETFMKRDIGSQSRVGKTALLVFFGQQVVEEILDAQRPACPPEYFNIEIPENHEYRKVPKHTAMPLLRTRFDARTGFSPGNPRQQLNEITPWLDGGLTYGTSKAWADQLRRYANGTVDKDGRLAGANNSHLFPEYNTHRLPLANPPPPALHHIWVKQHETAKIDRFFKLGNPRGNENPFLLTFGVMWFRWHNALARDIREEHQNWSSERVFNEARKWLIASHQSIVIYEWLPSWLGTDLDPYKGYNAALDPQIDQFFQSAAMRFGHTLVTPGVYMRDYVRNGCGLLGPEKVVRTCNFFWRPQEPMLFPANDNGGGHGGGTTGIADIDRLLMGMATQLTEAEDHTIVEDLRGRVFGPLEFSRRDLMAVNIQRGRDHGLPDFNTARKAYGLNPITDENHFNHTTPTYRALLKEVYSRGLKNTSQWVDHIDVWVGGIMETGDSPGELFTAVIKDQFTRIRDADRFWFENKQNGLFTEDEIKRLKELRLRDIIMSVTHMEDKDMQSNPFLGPKTNEIPECKNPELKNVPCSAHDDDKMCRVLPALSKTNPHVKECVAANTYDYFSNSELSYILTFLGLSLMIGGFVVLLFLMHFKKEKERNKKVEKTASNLRASFSGHMKTSISAKEWVGPKEGERVVLVALNESKRQVEVLSQIGELLRGVDLTHCSDTNGAVEVMLANDGLHVLLRTSNDYDLILKFDTEYLRKTFIARFDEFLEILNVAKIGNPIALHIMQKQAVTYAKRQKLVEQFYRNVFSQAFKIGTKDDTSRVTERAPIDLQKMELTKAEFAAALSMQVTSSFVQHMFSLVDKNKNGFISFREFTDMLVIFHNGSAEDKAKLMFDMYDVNSTGKLTRKDFADMLRSLIETVEADVEQKDLEKVVTSMMQKAGLQHKDEMELQDFQRLLQDYNDKIELAQLEFSGAKQTATAAPGVRHRPKSFAARARHTVISIYGNPMEDMRLEAAAKAAAPSIVSDQEETVRHRQQESKYPHWTALVSYLQNNQWAVFWVVLYTLVLLAIFAERAYYYSVEREHSGLRRIAGYGVTVTRGAASAMMFTYSTLLLTMCRNIITRLRETWLHRYVPFDYAVDMHKYIAIWALIFTVMHAIGHAINFYHISTQTSNDLTCLFRNFFHPTHVLPKFHYWCWQTITGFTGIVLTTIAALMFIYALPFARRSLYNWFWFTHSLYPLFYLFTILHGAGRLIQAPFFHYFFLGPCILYVLDSLVSVTRKKVEIPVIKAELLPSGVTMLEFKRPSNFDYKSGQWMRIACPTLNSGEYHPFTISSAPNEANLTLHIRAVGPWTKNIRQLYDPASRAGGPLPKLFLDGPYGESHQDWYQYEVAILVGGGIGVTPFASILKDIVYRANNLHAQIACKKVYFFWITKTQKHFEWFVDIIRELEKADTKLVVSVHIFVTQFYQKFDLRMILLYICERHFQRFSGVSLFTGLKAKTHFNRPNCEEIFKNIKSLHSKASKIGVFSCGPASMTQSVDQACTKVNSATKDGPIYQHHFENF